MRTDVSLESAHCATTESASDPIVLQMTAGASYGRAGSREAPDHEWVIGASLMGAKDGRGCHW
jgi:hypothetical protein